MSALRNLLKDADPVAHEPPLSDEDVRRMRRAVLAAPRAGRWTPRWIRVTALAGGATMLALAAVALKPSPRLEPAGDQAVAPIGPDATRRQLQFAAPGGTRVIWVFNADFEP